MCSRTTYPRNVPTTDQLQALAELGVEVWLSDPVLSEARAARASQDLTGSSGQADRSTSHAPLVVSVARKSILVVEDDEPLRTLMETLFLNEGFEVRSAGHGIHALRLVNEQAPDLIVRGPDAAVGQWHR